MEYEESSFIEVNVVRDSTNLQRLAGRMTIAVRNIASVSELPSQEHGAHVVLREVPLPLVSWVFRGENDAESASYLELTVAEEYGVVKWLLRAAIKEPRIWTATDYEEWLKRQYILQTDVQVGPENKIVLNKSPQKG